MNERLLDLMRARSVSLVILDDAHHLLDYRTEKMATSSSSWLQFIIQESGTPFVAVGLPGEIQKVVESSFQLSRLFPSCYSLPTFGRNPQTPDTINEFSETIECVEQMAGMRLSTRDLDREAMLRQTHRSTN